MIVRRLSRRAGRVLGRAILAIVLTGAAAAAASSTLAPPDGPALSVPGPYAVGVIRLDLTNPDQPDLTAPRTPAGAVARHERLLPLTVWYPGTHSSDAAPAHYRQHVAGPVASGGSEGMAFASAAPVRGARFPLVVLSPGYRSWATGFSDLAEGLASRGYVVAAIDHRDADPSPGISDADCFAMTLVSRSADQRFVIAELVRRAQAGPLAGVYDPDRIALIGYSMGGFGAITTVGGGLDPTGPLYRRVPDGLLAPFAEGAPAIARGAPAGVKAVVAFAPWGGSAALRAWRPSGLAQVRTPTLVIVGDQDDVSGYTDGVAWLYDRLTGADRRLLVYQNARHNIAGDGIAGAPHADFAMIEHLEEPVWRRDRILAINRHFVVAFLDAVLKGDAAHAAFLAVPTIRAADGIWPLVPGSTAGARLASPDDGDSRGYWPGFQRRWALGLELHHDRALVPPAS